MNRPTLIILAIVLTVIAAALDCPPGQHQSEGNCTACLNNTYSQGGNASQCQPCTQCQQCQPTTGNCLQCPPGSAPSNQNCNACPSPTFSLGIQPCQSCPNCTACSSSSGICTSCLLGFQLINGSCSQCPSLTFAADGVGPCQPCVGCSACSSENGLCSACLPGYGLSENQCISCQGSTFSAGGTSSCQQCDASCASCSSTSGQCLQCLQNQQPQGTVCLLCPSGYYSNGRLPCNNCSIACVTCQSSTGICQQCQAGFQLEGTICVQCPANTYNSNGTGLCINCHASCLSCDLTTGNCMQCIQNFYPIGFTCSSCPPGTFSQGIGSCQSCGDFCLACNSTTGLCTSCSPGSSLSSGQCSSCGPTGYNPTGEGPCLPCTSSCGLCDNITGVCSYCLPFYELNSSSSQCVACLQNQYTNIDTNLCQNCDKSCSSCIGPLPSNCTGCPPNSGLVNDSFCQPCVNGTVSDGVNPCYLCNVSKCINCLSDNQCETCSSNYTAFNGVCAFQCQLPNCVFCVEEGTCVLCLFDYTLQSNGTCVECTPQGCAACLQPNICSRCEDGLNFSSTGNGCVSCQLDNCQSCSQDQYCSVCSNGYESIGGTCSLCGIQYCSACQQSNCTACSLGYVLTSNNRCQVPCSIPNCLSCSQSNVCSSCVDNYELNQDLNICQEICEVSACLNCSNGICLQCMSSFILFGGRCLQQCSMENCLACKLGTLGQCETCVQGLVPSTDGSACVLNTSGNCSSYSYSLGCSVCLYDLIPQGPQCLSCMVDNCQNCQTNNVCGQSGCFTGFTFNSQYTSTHDQCLACLPPCQTCYPNGDCLLCVTPYSQATLSSGNQCFLCYDANCEVCTDSSQFSCLNCRGEYSAVNGSCQLPCAAGCDSCLNGVCQACSSYYYLGTDGLCHVCPGAPQCRQCYAQNPSTCSFCSNGYYSSSDGLCYPCQSYCSYCSDGSSCQVLANPIGFVLVTYSSVEGLINSSPAACDPACIICSPNNPQLCSGCTNGYYLTSQLYCAPCAYDSLCMQCSVSNPAVCLTCFSGFTLTNATCLPCIYPCAACQGGNITKFLACVEKFVYVPSNNTCIDSTNDAFDVFSGILDNCGNAELLIASDGSPQVTCTLCIQGYTATAKGCLPCIQDCLICNPQLLNRCSQCLPGFSLTSTYTCTPCVTNCLTCSLLGCQQCVQGYTLNQNFTCQLACLPPCSTCSVSDPTACSSCLLGYLMIGGQCQPDTSCNSNLNCLVCPFGSSLRVTGDILSVSQICILCDSDSNCARCNVTNPSQCLSCMQGYYLQGNTCQPCSEDCSVCISFIFCTVCAPGFVASQSATLSSQSSTGFVICFTCQGNCKTCLNSAYTCTSCNDGFSLAGTSCVSQFNFQVNTTLEVTLPVFQANFMSFLGQIAIAAQVDISDILILSIVNGSVTVIMQINSYAPPGTDIAVQTEANLNTLLKKGTVGNMAVAYSSVTTNGGSNHDGNDNNDNNDNDRDTNGADSSDATIIALAIIIPLMVLVIIGASIFFLRSKRSKIQPEDMVTLHPETGKVIEMVTIGSAQNSRRQSIL